MAAASVAVLAVSIGVTRTGGFGWTLGGEPSAFPTVYWLESLLLIVTVLTLALATTLTARKGPFPAVRSYPTPDGAEALLEEERYRQHAAWLVRLRWMVLLTAATLTVGACSVVPLLDAWLVRPLGACIALLAFVNVVLSNVTAGPAGTRSLIRIQIVLDLVLLTAMLHFSGGLENPLTVLYVFHVLLAGMLLSPGECYATAVLASVLYCAMATAELTRQIPHYSLALFPPVAPGLVSRALVSSNVIERAATEVFALLCAAYLTGIIVRQLRATEQGLVEMSSRLLAERRKLDLIVESAGAGLLLLDPEMRVSWFNRYARDWFRLDESSLGQLWVPPACEPSETSQPLVPVEISGPMQEPRTRVTECTLRDAADTPRTLLITTTPVLGSTGQVVQVVKLFHDITQLRQARSQLLHAAKLAAIGQLAGTVAHEVNNPLAIIAAKVRLLLSDFDGQVPERVISELRKVVEQADRLAAMTHRLLSVCRPSPGIRQPVNVDDVVATVMDLVSPRITGAGVKPNVNRDCSGTVVLGNADELQQVLLNLVTNALDAMPHGGELTVASKMGPPLGATSERSVVLSVRDTGGGISPEHRGHIFEPFFSTKEEGRGTGLGLAISQGIVQEHGGVIAVDSTPRDGTTFTVQLPVPARSALGLERSAS
ncbi:MAG: PAS domain-containing protein [Candidatus Wallbacteria bacterium]|nr:PAS domain-containing protein [Candidatus Wallbacteria bacterium]